jgi:hypothetical protein
VPEQYDLDSTMRASRTLLSQPAGASPQVALHEDGVLAELIQEAGLSVEKVGDVVWEYRWDDLGTALRAQASVGPVALAIAML